MQKQYDPTRSYEQARLLWTDERVYQFTGAQGKLAYIIDTPPPTVSGSLHIGHIFSYTHQDIIARYKRMSGYDVLYPFGFDDNGLPTERFVEKKRGISPLQMGRSRFVQEIIQETVIAQQQFRELWTRMGLSVDWSASYSTIDDRTRRISQKSFIDLYAQSDVYRAHRAAPYCTTCYTSVAQAELEDAQVPSQFIQIGFAHADNRDQSLIIATTRPEYLASCCAVLVHPDDIRYSSWIGQQVVVPLYGNLVPVIADPDVKIDKGTGAVMCCAFGDTLDITWIARHEFSYRQILQTSGRFAADLAIIGDLKVKPARQAVVQALLDQGLVINQEAITHAVQVHERCKQEVEYLYLQQWFVATSKHTPALSQATGQVSWHPAYMEVRCQEWIEHLKWDWCISRQRFYGIPFPCWHCRSCEQVIMARADQLPIDPQETPWDKPCPHCGADGAQVVPDTDIMDTWNTSSLTPYIIQEIAQERTGTKISLPLSLRPQAHDIIRTWAFYTIVKAWLHDKTIPWTDIVISGHVLSSAHQKISKSQGNSPLDPERLLATYSADAIRYWAGSAQLGTDTAFSENQLKIGNKLVTKLWNAFIFVHEHGQVAHDPRRQEPKDPINRWVLSACGDMIRAYTKAQDNFDFQAALTATDHFFWATWCDTYLELIKDRFFYPERYDASVIDETRGILYHIGFVILQRYAPYVPFVTEAIYQDLYRPAHQTASFHATTYTLVPDIDNREELHNQAILVQDIVDQVRKIKSEAKLSLKTDLDQLTIYATVAQQLSLESVNTTLLGATRAARIEFLAPEPEGVARPSLLTQTDGSLRAVVVLQEQS